MNDQPIWRSFSRAYLPALYLDRKSEGWCPGVTTKAVILIGVRTCKPVFSSLFHVNSLPTGKSSSLPVSHFPIYSIYIKTSVLSQCGLK